MKAEAFSHLNLRYAEGLPDCEDIVHDGTICAYAYEDQACYAYAVSKNKQVRPMRAFMALTLAEKIKAIRNSMGLQQVEFAEKLDTTQSTVSRWERGAKPEWEYLCKIADLANTTVERLTGASDLAGVPANAIPVVGYVGAGAQVLPYDDYANGGGIDYVERPEGVTGQAVAVEVQGDSLFPTAENGWRLIYTGNQTILEEEVLNRLCVVQLVDGRMLVKRVLRGSIPGRYHLQSTNAPLIEDAEVEWAAKVKAIIPD